ncbi:hypothetical protein Dimus_027936 [Dionaea muscipula]
MGSAAEPRGHWGGWDGCANAVAVARGDGDCCFGHVSCAIWSGPGLGTCSCHHSRGGSVFVGLCGLAGTDWGGCEEEWLYLGGELLLCLNLNASLPADEAERLWMGPVAEFLSPSG